MYEFVGFQNLFMEISPQEFKKNVELIQKIQNQTKIKLFYRVTVHTNDVNEFNCALNKISNYKALIIVLQSTNKDLLTFAAKNSRIDVLSFSSVEEIKSLTPGIISLIKQSKKYIEISLIDLFMQKTFERSRSFREIYKILRLANNKEHIFIYAGLESSIYYIKGPREIISILNSIFEIPLSKAKSILSTNPSGLIENIQNRTDVNFLEDGVRIVKE